LTGTEFYAIPCTREKGDLGWKIPPSPRSHVQSRAMQSKARKVLVEDIQEVEITQILDRTANP
jgi:hypothetical protein